jgi:hypothetical protein
MGASDGGALPHILAHRDPLECHPQSARPAAAMGRRMRDTMRLAMQRRLHPDSALQWLSVGFL